jgi:pyrimidine-nucleoside phosphorylase
MSRYHVPTLIARKRDGEELEEQEIQYLIDGYNSGDVMEAQMSAFAMAVYFRGMTAAETAALTRSMMHSGDCFSFPSGHPPIVDKHSTGGIGDKVSLVLAPLVACTGCWIPMVSGRGLGITGGTLDKMESIPGFRIDLSMERAVQQLSEIGVVMMGQTERFCPADKKLYALRDVTATVPSIPLITASIMSKKLAESLQRLVLDVKYGSGAFMKTREQAVALADSMVAVGKQMGVDVFTLLNPMNEPLGHAVGNALEVIESIEAIRGNGPQDLVELVVSQAEIITRTPAKELQEFLQSGKCWEKFLQLISAQGGNPDDLLNLSQLQKAPIIQEVRAKQSGQVTKVDAGMVGQAALLLGAGRNRASDSVDPRVGFDQLVKTSTIVSAGDLLGRVHAATSEQAENAAYQLLAAIEISS